MKTRKEILKDIFSQYRKLANCTFNLNNWVWVLNKFREEYGDTLSETDTTGKIAPVSVGEMYAAFAEIGEDFRRISNDLMQYLQEEYNQE